MDGSIEVRNLDVVFHSGRQKVHALKHASITLQEGKITGLIGESGSGKSVLALSLLRLLPAYAEIQGEIRYRGRNLLTLSPEQMRSVRRSEIALIPQDPSESLNPSRRGLAQVRECFVGSGKYRRNRSLENLKKLGFADPGAIGKMYPYQLSGGMKQRVVSQFGMRDNISWIVADEPTKGLDTIVFEQVYETLHSLVADGKTSMLVITHDLLLAYKLCDELAVLYEGEIVEQGPAKEVLMHPKHPYTAGLIRSIPHAGMEAMDLKPDKNPAGCFFASCCPMAGDRCRSGAPELISLENQRKVRCFHYDSDGKCDKTL